MQKPLTDSFSDKGEDISIDYTSFQASQIKRVSVFGMGYVGAVTCACLASRGHSVIGVDTNPEKVEMLKKGISPIVEKDLPELVLAMASGNNMKASTNAREAILNTDISIICVGTPSRGNGSLDNKYLLAVSEEIGKSLKDKEEEHILIFRSTMVPGTLKNNLIPIIEETSGKKEGKDFHICFNPEFLRESTSVYDFFNPPKTVVGCKEESVAKEVFELYGGLPGPMIHTSIEVAEMVKYVDNTYHALKISFANEIGQICKSLDIDSHAVMDIFVQDTKLNISKAYLKPGFAFGGSCLPKDLRALTYLAKSRDVPTPLLNSVLESNEKLIDSVFKEIISLGKKKLSFAGFSFKAGTDDLRESPIVELIEKLLGKGYIIKLYDEYVQLSRLTGANKQYIENAIPHIGDLMVNTLQELTKDCEVLIIGNKAPEFKALPATLTKDQIVYDLVRIDGKFRLEDMYRVVS